MQNPKDNQAWRRFSYNIKWLREKYEFSEERMSEILGMSINMLKETERGELPEELTCEIIVRIHNFFGVDAMRIWERLK